MSRDNNVAHEVETEGADARVSKGVVYVREADPSQLPDELKGQPGKIYALHDMRGNQIALAPNRGHAFALARRNDLTALSVH